MTYGKYHSINLVVAQGLGLLGGFQFGSQFEITFVPAVSGHYYFHGPALTGTGVADVDSFTFQISEFFDAGVGPGNHGERFGVHGKYRPQALVGTLVFKFAATVVGMVLPVRLGHTHIQLAGGDGVEVVDGTAGTFDRAANPMGFAGFVDQTADSPAGGIIDTGHAAGPDGNKGLPGLNRLSRGTHHERKTKQQCNCKNDSLFHLFLLISGY